jgi:dienelactone hydrolase
MTRLCLVLLLTASIAQAKVKFETVTLKEGGPEATIQLAYVPNAIERRPVILMLGALDGKVPDWATDLVNEGYVLAAFTVAHPPDPDPDRRPQWLYFDERFAHSYPLGGYRVQEDSRRVVAYLDSRKDVNPDKIGWLGSSTTGIIGLSAVTQGPRLAAFVGFVSTGAYREWLASWKTNGLWKGKTDALWPETEELLKKYDPIDHVDKMYPTAVLIVDGGADKVVDAKTAKSFVEAARPYYKTDPDRLRLVIYDGFGHNLPRDIIKMYAEHWFHLYMHPTNPPPQPPDYAKDLNESVTQTQVNSADHKDITGSK